MLSCCRSIRSVVDVPLVSASLTCIEHCRSFVCTSQLLRIICNVALHLAFRTHLAHNRILSRFVPGRLLHYALFGPERRGEGVRFRLGRDGLFGRVCFMLDRRDCSRRRSRVPSHCAPQTSQSRSVWFAVLLRVNRLLQSSQKTSEPIADILFETVLKDCTLGCPVMSPVLINSTSLQARYLRTTGYSKKLIVRRGCLA